DSTHYTRIFQSDDVAGVTTNSSRETLLIWPNPASGSLHFSNFQKYLSGFYSITNIHGQELLNETIFGNTIDVSDLENGIYFLQLKSPTGSEQLMRFIVDK